MIIIKYAFIQDSELNCWQNELTLLASWLGLIPAELHFTLCVYFCNGSTFYAAKDHFFLVIDIYIKQRMVIFKNFQNQCS